jgi:hypothetical protein
MARLRSFGPGLLILGWSFERLVWKKMEKLNKSFLNWMNQQMIDHPLSLWSDAVNVSEILQCQVIY